MAQLNMSLEFRRGERRPIRLGSRLFVLLLGGFAGYGARALVDKARRVTGKKGQDELAT